MFNSFFAHSLLPGEQGAGGYFFDFEREKAGYAERQQYQGYTRNDDKHEGNIKRALNDAETA